MSYQKWIKWESERCIINSLYDGDRSFSDLVELTDLSKPVLSQRLKELIREGKIKSIPEIETKRFLYHLNYENLDTMDELHIRLHTLSKIVVSYLAGFSKDSSISDEEYTTRLMDCVSMLFNFRLLSYTVAPTDVQKEWLKNTLGLEFVGNIAQLFPENRNVLKFTIRGMPSKETAIFRAEDTREAANQLLEFLNSIIEKITRR